LIIFCAAVTVTTFLISGFLTYLLGKIDFSYPAKLSGSGGIFAGTGFLPDLEKVPDSGWSRSRNPVQP